MEKAVFTDLLSIKKLTREFNMERSIIFEPWSQTFWTNSLPSYLYRWFLPQSNNSERSKTLSSSLKLESFANNFLALGIARQCTCPYIRWFMEEGGKFICRFVLFVLFYNTNFVKNLNLMIFKLKTKNNSLTVQIFSIYKVTPLSTQSKFWSTYYRGRESFVGLQYLYDIGCSYPVQAVE